MTSLNKVTFIDPNHLPGLLFFYSTEQLNKIQQMCEATEKITKPTSREVTFTVFPDSSLLFQEYKKSPEKKTKKPKIKNWSHYSWTRWTKACCTVKRRGRTVQTQLGECLTNLFVHLHRTLRWPVSQSGYKPLLSDRGAQTKHNTHL